MNKTVLSIATSVLVLGLAVPAARSMEFTKADGDGTCAAGLRLAEAWEVNKDAAGACNAATAACTWYGPGLRWRSALTIRWWSVAACQMVSLLQSAASGRDGVKKRCSTEIWLALSRLAPITGVPGDVATAVASENAMHAPTASSTHMTMRGTRQRLVIRKRPVVIA